MKLAISIGLSITILDDNSEEKIARREKIKELHKLMDEEKERINPELNKLNAEHSKWFVDTSNIDDLITLGKNISAYVYGIDDDRKQCEKRIQGLLKTDKSLYNRYVEWQGSDEYIRSFKDE